ncbi:hypothetical protein MHU86_9701 [Fragilaria crotonensis]|nr:hypothetical protein MHU86_9701 [Fragilaria crotonensis]
MASHGWVRVAMGLRKVAHAAALHVADQGQGIVTRGVQHGVELGANTRLAAMAAMAAKISEPVVQASTLRNTSNSMTVESIPFVESTHIEPEQSKQIQVEMLRHDDTLSIVSENESEQSKQIGEVSDQEPNTQSEADQTVVSKALIDDKSQETDLAVPYDRLREGQHVPSSRVGRAFGFATLGLGLVLGTAAEATSRLLGGASTSGSVVANDANADRLAATLCRMRGAALKMGQMLSIQDESLLPPALTKALQKVRQGADAMPKKQLEKQLKSQLGDSWRDRFETFDDLPFAAASIGQVHRAKIRVGEQVKDVVVKVQYPGVANSIESDLQNLTMLVKMTGFAPKGLFIDNVIRVGRDELKVECDYVREMENQLRFKELVENDPILSRERFVVPDVMTDYSTAEILTTEYAKGGTIDKVLNLDQDERNRIGRHIFYLTIQELFVWRFMQTDPNWGNFLYDVGSRTTTLIDFGAAREYPKSFVDGYLRIVWCNANRDEETLLELSHKMGFLTGQENAIMMEAHTQSGFTLGEPFATDEPFDFRGSNISSRLSAQSSAFMQHRLTPPPEEVYTLHRKLAGAFMLCIKLGAKVKCRDLLVDVIKNHQFDDGMEPPKV